MSQILIAWPLEVAMAPRYRIELAPDERAELESIARPGKTESRRYVHARALLLCDAGEGGEGWTVAAAAGALGIATRTVERPKRLFVEEGMAAALDRKEREAPPREVVFDGAFEARLIALACSEAPEGRARWTVRLLADKAVELGLAESVSHMTVQRALKKTNLSLTSGGAGRSPRRRARRS
jgi:hypothetical protein